MDVPDSRSTTKQTVLYAAPSHVIVRDGERRLVECTDRTTPTRDRDGHGIETGRGREDHDGIGTGRGYEADRPSTSREGERGSVRDTDKPTPATGVNRTQIRSR